MARNILTSTRTVGDGNLPYYHLPKGMLKLTVNQVGGSYEVSSDIVVIPDPDHRYFLRYNGNAFTYDKIDITFTKEGFLKEITTTIKDETGEVIKALGDLGAEAAKAAAGLVSTRSATQPVLVYEHTFDPFDAASLGQVNEELAMIKTGITLSIRPLGKNEETGNAADNRNRFGVYCRPVAPYEILYQGTNWMKRELKHFPHPEVINFVEIPTASFVESHFTMSFGFDDDPLYAGYPNKISVDNPSSALAIIKAPIEVLKALIRIPAEIFQLKIDIASQRTEAARQEQNLMHELKNKEMSEKKVRDELELFRREAQREREVLKKEKDDAEKQHKKDLLKAESQIGDLRRELDDIKE